MKKILILVWLALFSSHLIADTPPVTSIRAKVYNGDGTQAIGNVGDALKVNVTAISGSSPVDQGDAGLDPWLVSVVNPFATETTLSTINGKIPSGLTVTSTRLLVDGSGVTQPISAASLPLPSGAATETTLSAINGKLNSLGQKTSANSVPVVLSSDQSTINTSSQASLNTVVTGSSSALNGDCVAATDVGGYKEISLQVSITGTNTQSLQGSNDNITFFAAPYTVLNTNLSAPNTALTSSNLVRVPVTYKYFRLRTTAFTSGTCASTAMLTPYASGNDIGLRTVAVTSTGSSLPLPTVTPVQLVRNDYTSTNVTTSAYVQLIASTSGIINQMYIFDSSGQTLFLATGGAGSEVNQAYIVPGGNGLLNLTIAAGTRISVKAVSATASVGELNISFFR